MEKNFSLEDIIKGIESDSSHKNAYQVSLEQVMESVRKNLQPVLRKSNVIFESLKEGHISILQLRNEIERYKKKFADDETKKHSIKALEKVSEQLSHDDILNDEDKLKRVLFCFSSHLSIYPQKKYIEDKITLKKRINKNRSFALVNNNFPSSLFSKKENLLKRYEYSEIEKDSLRMWKPLNFTIRELEVISAIYDLIFQGKAIRLGLSSYIVLKSKNELFDLILDRKKRNRGYADFRGSEVKIINDTIDSLMHRKYEYLFWKGDKYLKSGGVIIQNKIERYEKAKIKEIPSVSENDFILQINNFFFFDNPKYKKIPSIKHLKNEIRSKFPKVRRISDTVIHFILFLVFQSGTQNKITRSLHSLISDMKNNNLENRLRNGYKKFVVSFLKRLSDSAVQLGYLSKYNIHYKEDEIFFEFFVSEEKMKNQRKVKCDTSLDLEIERKNLMEDEKQREERLRFFFSELPELQKQCILSETERKLANESFQNDLTRKVIFLNLIEKCQSSLSL